MRRPWILSLHLVLVALWVPGGVCALAQDRDSATDRATAAPAPERPAASAPATVSATARVVATSDIWKGPRLVEALLGIAAVPGNQRDQMRMEEGGVVAEQLPTTTPTTTTTPGTARATLRIELHHLGS